MIKAHLAEKLPAPATTRHPRIFACQVSGLVNAAAETTILSQHITCPYTVTNLTIRFPAGADNVLRVYPLIGLDDSVSTSGPPPGFLFLAELSPTPYIIGDDCLLSFPLDHHVYSKGTWLKLHLDNNDVAAHTISAIFSLREIITPED